VLGDPAYYGRFGFIQEHKVTPPYPLPTQWVNAWQSIKQCDREPPLAGKLSVPEPWRQSALWSA
jgi:putative acetyltransferase